MADGDPSAGGKNEETDWPEANTLSHATKAWFYNKLCLILLTQDTKSSAHFLCVTSKQELAQFSDFWLQALTLWPVCCPSVFGSNMWVTKRSCMQVGRALDWRSKGPWFGPWFDPGFRHCQTSFGYKHLVPERLVLCSLSVYGQTVVIPNTNKWFHGVMVSTLDFESSDPSSNLGGTCAWVGRVARNVNVPTFGWF